MEEAQLEERGAGLAPAGDGWFVVNVRDAMWLTSEGGEKTPTGSECPFESRHAYSTRLGVRIHTLPPGQSNGLYHSEAMDEAFLVLAGECRLLVEGEERILRAWDFFRCPAGTEHIFVGAGDGPCAILCIGARPGEDGEWGLNYPLSELAARYGASAEAQTSDPDVAYAEYEPSRIERPAYWDSLPWA